MPRPRRLRRVNFSPKVTYFKPQGVPLRELKIVELSVEETDALRLKNVKKLSQVECAKEMHTSQSTFQRVLTIAEEKISMALVDGCAIRIVDSSS